MSSRPPYTPHTQPTPIGRTILLLMRCRVKSDSMSKIVALSKRGSKDFAKKAYTWPSYSKRSKSADMVCDMRLLRRPHMRPHP
jgi:hypothetical protein